MEMVISTGIYRLYQIDDNVKFLNNDVVFYEQRTDTFIEYSKDMVVNDQFKSLIVIDIESFHFYVITLSPNYSLENAGNFLSKCNCFISFHPSENPGNLCKRCFMVSHILYQRKDRIFM